MKDSIERRSIAARLADRVEEEIRAGTWKVKLPGKRTLAERFGVNVKTCTGAMILLVDFVYFGWTLTHQTPNPLPAPACESAPP